MTAWDIWLLEALNRWVARSPAAFQQALAWSDRLPWVLAALAVTWMWFSGEEGMVPIQGRFTRLDARRRTLTVFVALVVGFALARLLQSSVNRLRPLATWPLQVPIVPGTWETVRSSLETHGAFPSDHAVMFFIIALGLWSLNRRTGWVALGLTLYFSALRVGLGFHWPSDMLGGALVGAVALAVGIRIEHWFANWLDALLVFFYRFPALFYFLGFLVLFDLSQKFTNLFGIITWITGHAMVH